MKTRRFIIIVLHQKLFFLIIDLFSNYGKTANRKALANPNVKEMTLLLA